MKVYKPGFYYLYDGTLIQYLGDNNFRFEKDEFKETSFINDEKFNSRINHNSFSHYAIREFITYDGKKKLMVYFAKKNNGVIIEKMLCLKDIVSIGYVEVEKWSNGVINVSLCIRLKRPYYPTFSFKISKGKYDEDPTDMFTDKEEAVKCLESLRTDLLNHYGKFIPHGRRG